MSQPYLPMLGKDAPKVDGEIILPVGREWVYERKRDGWRWIVEVTPSGVRCYSGRNGMERTGAVPHICRELSFLPDGTVLDGELVLTESDGMTGMGGSPAVARALAHGESLTYYVFDVLQLAVPGEPPESLIREPLSIRSAYLNKMAAGFDGEHVRLSVVEPSDPQVHERNLLDGYEGTIAKRVDAPYRPGKRSDAFTKIKPQMTDEAVVVGFIAGKGGIAGQVGAFEVRMLSNDVVTSCGVPPALRAEVTNHGAELWLGKVIEFAHHGIREDSGKPRHIVFKHRRDDR